MDYIIIHEAIVYTKRIEAGSEIRSLLNTMDTVSSERGLQLQRALEMAKQAIMPEPDNAAYLDTYGWILFKLQKYEDAAMYIESPLHPERLVLLFMSTSAISMRN